MSATVLTGSQIDHARLLTLRGCVKLECLGMKHSAGSVTEVVRREFGWKGTKRRIHYLLNQRIVEILGPDFDRPLPK